MNEIIFYDESDPLNASVLRTMKYDASKVPQIGAEIRSDGILYNVKSVRFDYDANEVVVFLE